MIKKTTNGFSHFASQKILIKKEPIYLAVCMRNSLVLFYIKLMLTHTVNGMETLNLDFTTLHTVLESSLYL